MKVKKSLVLWLVFFSLIATHTVLFTQLQANRDTGKQSLHIRALPLPPSFYTVLTGEFQGLAADFLYLDIAATLGGREKPNLSTTEWDGLEKMFAVAVTLDPHFTPTFRAVQAYLPWLAKRPEAANRLLTIVSESRNWDWQPPFFIGFNHYFFLNDNKAASIALMDAAKREQAPTALATFGARLAAESGAEDAGIELLTRLLQTKESEFEKKPLQDRIEALRGVKQLKELVARYKAEQGVNPPNLHDLIFLGYVKDLPVNPYYDSYFYQDGVVRFDPFPQKNKAGRLLPKNK